MCKALLSSCYPNFLIPSYQFTVEYFLKNDLEPVAYLVYMVVLFLQFNQRKAIRHWVLSVYSLFAAVSIYVGIILTENEYKKLVPQNSIWHFLTEQNNWTYSLVYIINACVFSWLFYTLLRGKIRRIIIIACCLVNVIFFIYTDIISNLFLSAFNSAVYGLTFLTIILYTLLYLYELLTNIKEENLLEDFDFWLICGYLLYYLGSFVIVIYYQNADPPERGSIWSMNNIILFICSLILLVAYFKIPKNKKIMV